MPPVASTLIALLKNTSVAAVFGVIEAAAQMKLLTNNHADERWGIFFAFALGYVILRRAGLAPRRPPRASLEDRLMAAGVLFDAPGPRTVARHRIYTVVGRGRAPGLVAYVV